MSVITIAFDDGYEDTYIHCADFLTRHGIKATFAVPSDLIGKTLENRHVIDHGQFLSLKNKGHEIASHTVTHHNLVEVLKSEGKKAAKKEINESRRQLEEALGEKVESFVFPYIENNYNDYLIKTAARYYSSIRITNMDFVFNELPIKNPFPIVGVAITCEKSIEKYNQLIDKLSGNENLWLIEVFHLVSDKNTKSAHRDEPYRFFTHIEDFKKHIQYILSKNIRIITQREGK